MEEAEYPRSPSRLWPAHVKQERFNISHVYAKLRSFFRLVIRDFFFLDLCTLVSTLHLREKLLPQPFVILLPLTLAVPVRHQVRSVTLPFLIGSNRLPQLPSRLDSPLTLERQGEDREHRHRTDNLASIPSDVVNAPSMICLEYLLPSEETPDDSES